MNRRNVFKRIGQAIGALIGHAIGFSTSQAAEYPGIDQIVTIDGYHARTLVDGMVYLLPYLPDDQRSWFLQSEMYATVLNIKRQIDGVIQGVPR